MTTSLADTPRKAIIDRSPLRRQYLCANRSRTYYRQYGKEYRGRSGAEEIQITLGRHRFPAAIKLREGASDTKALKKEAEAMKRSLSNKDQERDAVIRLCRRRQMDDETVDQQLNEIEREKVELTEALHALQERILATEHMETQVHSAEALLKCLNERLDAPLTWEAKRQLVETLVEGIRVETIEGAAGRTGSRQTLVTVNYRFSPPTASSSFVTRTGSRAGHNRGIVRAYKVTRGRIVLIPISSVAATNGKKPRRVQGSQGKNPRSSGRVIALTA